MTSCGSEFEDDLHGRWLPLESSTIQLARCSRDSRPEMEEGEEEGNWDCIELPRTMLDTLPKLLEGGSSSLEISKTATPLGAKRRMIFDGGFSLYESNDSMIPSSPCIAPAKYEIDSSLLNSLKHSPFSLQDLKAADKKYSHWDRQEIVRPKMRRAVSEGGGNNLIPGEGISRPVDEISNLINSNVGIAHLLPCFDSPRDAIKRISPTIMSEVLAGQYAGLFSNLMIIDCRYPYEFHGGHLPSAINICSLKDINHKLFSGADLSQSHSTVIIFHCEFSSERAPRMALHVRNFDRILNGERYPSLYYPQIYVLDGGYKQFFLQHPALCEPPYQYVPMRNSEHRDELRYHQRLKFNDNHSHGKHRHKLRSCSLRKSHSLAIPHPVSAISSYFRARESIPSTFLTGDLLSSDTGDICDQTDSILQAAESVLLTIDDGRASK